MFGSGIVVAAEKWFEVTFNSVLKKVSTSIIGCPARLSESVVRLINSERNELLRMYRKTGISSQHLRVR